MGGGEGLGTRLEVSWDPRRGRPGDKARGVMGGGEGLGTRLEVSSVPLLTEPRLGHQRLEHGSRHF